MTIAALFLFFSSLIGVACTVCINGNRGLDAMAVIALASITLLSPVSAIWLLGSSMTVVIILRAPWAECHRGMTVSMLTGVLIAALLISRELHAVVWVGGAYFTLRHIHVMSEWWQGRLPAPQLRDYLRYQFFLPVIMAGPIHRLPHFERQCRRRRVTASQFFSGAERVLLGFTSTVVLASWAVRRLADSANTRVLHQPEFIRVWVDSVFDWLHIYFSFAGLSGIAIGLALMCGLVLEENFRQPWAARDLIDFWSRWHMTLSNWCRDYVFRPVSAVSRNALVGLIAAMLAMGLWHETTLYYVLWAVWQSLGIALTHLLRRFPVSLPERTARLLGWMSVPFWLTLTKPVVLFILEGVGL
jgi:alginate O-acetyltransferase complex protein AlgI